MPRCLKSRILPPIGPTVLSQPTWQRGGRKYQTGSKLNLQFRPQATSVSFPHTSRDLFLSENGIFFGPGGRDKFSLDLKSSFLIVPSPVRENRRGSTVILTEGTGGGGGEKLKAKGQGGLKDFRKKKTGVWLVS